MADTEYKKTVAFAGNPNVGKSTIFNELTGLKQHTGNWAGKTVSIADGCYTYNNNCYNIIDLPGTYSLISGSKEEEIARDYICFGCAEKVVVVCDATCMERNLSLALQTMEITDDVILCVNLIDEAENRKINIDYKKMSEILGISVIPVCARRKAGIEELKKEIENKALNKPFKIKYPDIIENLISIIENAINFKTGKINKRWIAIKLLCGDNEIVNSISEHFETDLMNIPEIKEAILKVDEILNNINIRKSVIKDKIASHIVITAEGICCDTVNCENTEYNLKLRKTDKLFTNKWFAYPFMFIMLAVIFFITIWGANYPSKLLSNFFVFAEEKLMELAMYLDVPLYIRNMLILGVFKVTGWVIAVMLPPMAIFFPLFTIMEDAGILPRIAFNLDKVFKKCNACGKQSLTMCMGFGCNAVGVTGCRIIDSKRERIIAILTNSFVPCNGRFPTIIAIISMFLVGKGALYSSSLWSALILTLIIVSAIGVTFLISKLLSETLLKGTASSYTLELPPFRKPQIFKIIIRSVFDRTLFVLGRAVAIAAPAGLIIWILGNAEIGSVPFLSVISSFLEPVGRWIGLDGVILISFILGFPANEIVVPIMLMIYLSEGTLVEYDNINTLKNILVDNGWTVITAINTIIFSLFHFPCSTTLLTIKKETGSLKWTLLAFLIPTITGITFCLITTFISNFF